MRTADEAARTRTEQRPETAGRTWTEQPPEAAPRVPAGPPPEATRRMPAGPAPADVTGRMSMADRVTGGPVWSGFLIGLATWIVLQVALVWGGLTGVRAGQGTAVQTSDWWWSLAAGLIGLFVGGLVAGMASRWHTTGAGVLQGLTVWALTFFVILVLAAVGAGVGFGAFSDAVGINPRGDGANVSPSAIQTAQDAAGVAVLLLIFTAVAAVIGGVLGARVAGRKGGRDDAAVTRYSQS